MACRCGYFDQIEWTRFPPKHSYNGLDAKFQNASVWFHGDVGRNTHTSGQFIEGLQLAYAKDKGTISLPVCLNMTLVMLSATSKYRVKIIKGGGLLPG